MPVFNAERWIAHTIEAILQQTFTDFALIISDNASTDGTTAICERFAQADPRVRYHRNQKNVGLFKNYDRVFELSASKYFKWASSNDYCKASFLERCVAVLEARPDVVLAYPQTALLTNTLEDAQPYDDHLDLPDAVPIDRWRALLTHIRLNNVLNGVMRADALRQTALNKVYASSDIGIVAELALRGKFVEVPERLFFRRMTEEAATRLRSTSDAAKFFANEPRDIHVLRQWRLEVGLLRGLLRAPIPWSQKLAGIRFLSRRWIESRDKLSSELVVIVKRLFGARPPR
jgi:glycosyltransferase involved in cell wall biosynthesis